VSGRVHFRVPAFPWYLIETENREKRFPTFDVDESQPNGRLQNFRSCLRGKKLSGVLVFELV